MKVTATTVCVYGLLLLIGGFIGHLKAGSQASLLSGLFFGIAMLLCSYAIYRGKLIAQYIALGLTFFLDGFFTYRYAKTLQFFPSGAMSLISLAVLIVIALKIRKSTKKH
jgi:uncharacterized membrane protein (UPF0136 family)